MRKLDEIAQEACELHGITPELLKGECREYEIVSARIFYVKAAAVENYNPRQIMTFINRERSTYYNLIKQSLVNRVYELNERNRKLYLEELNHVRDAQTPKRGRAEKNREVFEGEFLFGNG